jgi:hypothetical protein
MVSFSVVSVILSQLWSENIKWKNSRNNSEVFNDFSVVGGQIESLTQAKQVQVLNFITIYCYDCCIFLQILLFISYGT